MKIHSDENGVHLRLTRVEKNYLRALPTGLTPRTGHRREALKQMVAQEWPGPKEAADAAIGWFDEAMSAAHWLSLKDVAPDRAAMLLCQHDPNTASLEQARQSTNDATGPDDFVQLVQRFEDVAKCEPQHRSLVQWLQFARASKLRYHPWIDLYVEAVGLNVDDPAATVAGAAKAAEGQARQAPAGTINRIGKAGRSRDAIAGLIDRARAELGANASHQRVYALLESWARQAAPPPPLRRPAPGYIEWSDRGHPGKLRPEHVRGRRRDRGPGARGRKRA